MKLKRIVEDTWIKSSKKPGALTDKQKIEIIRKIAEYNKYASAIYNENDLIEIANELAEIASDAEALAVSEADEFDKITVSRNMKELRNLSQQFLKAAAEAQAFKQRLAGLYEDMGLILNRYFHIND